MVRPKKNPDKLQTNRVVIYLDDEELMDLEEICEILGFSKSAYFRLLFKFKIDFEDLSLGIEELHEFVKIMLDSISSGGTITVPKTLDVALLRPPPPPRAPTPSVTAKPGVVSARLDIFSAQVAIVGELKNILGPIREQMEQYAYTGIEN